MAEKQIKIYKQIAYIGIIGIAGLSYFEDHNLLRLFNLSYLAFFAYFPLYKYLKTEGIDERTKENLAKSNQIVAVIALIALVLVGVVPNTLYQIWGIELSPAIFIGSAVIGFFCAIIAQVCSFFYFENKN